MCNIDKKELIIYQNELLDDLAPSILGLNELYCN